MKCPKCNRAGLRQQVSVHIDAPADCRSLHKKGIRSKRCFILGVGWDRAIWYCKYCGWLMRLEDKKRKRLRKP